MINFHTYSDLLFRKFCSQVLFIVCKGNKLFISLVQNTWIDIFLECKETKTLKINSLSVQFNFYLFILPKSLAEMLYVFQFT